MAENPAIQPGDGEAISRVTHARRTVKVLPEDPQPLQALPPCLEAMLESAAMAPFHKAADRSWREGELDALMPWRAHVLDAAACRQLRESLLAVDDRGKMPAMLGAADAMVIVNWLPDPACEPREGQLFEPTVRNMEHVAAASAAVQNMLLTATAHGIPNYWSSGGRLREPAWLERLGATEGEILLGAIFFFPVGSDTGPLPSVTGKLRDLRGPLSGWVRHVTPDA